MQTGREESFCAWTLLPESPVVLVRCRRRLRVDCAVVAFAALPTDAGQMKRRGCRAAALPYPLQPATL